jgi:hypothetical protein
VSHNGPLALVDGDATVDDYPLIAALVARYGQGRDAEQVEVKIAALDGSSNSLTVAPIASENVLEEWHV